MNQHNLNRNKHFFQGSIKEISFLSHVQLITKILKIAFLCFKSLNIVCGSFQSIYNSRSTLNFADLAKIELKPQTNTLFIECQERNGYVFHGQVV